MTKRFEYISDCCKAENVMTGHSDICWMDTGQCPECRKPCKFIEPDAHASHTAAIREKAEALVAVNPVSVYRDKIVEYICEDDFDFTKILEEVEHEGEKYCDISQDGAFALVDYFLNLMEKVNEWRSEDAGQNYDFLHGKAELEKGNE